MCTARLFRNALFDRGRCAWSAYARRSSGRPATTSTATVVVAPSFNATGALNAPLLTATPSTKTPEMLADAAVTFISMASTRCEGTSATYRRVTFENAGANATASPAEAPTEGRGSSPTAAGVADATRSSMLTSDGSLTELAHRYSSHSPSDPVDRTPPSNSATSPSPSSSAYASPAASKPSGRHAGSQFAANTSMRVTTSSRRNSSAIEVRTSSPLATSTPFTSIL